MSTSRPGCRSARSRRWRQGQRHSAIDAGSHILPEHAIDRRHRPRSVTTRTSQSRSGTAEHTEFVSACTRRLAVRYQARADGRDGPALSHARPTIPLAPRLRTPGSRPSPPASAYLWSISPVVRVVLVAVTGQVLGWRGRAGQPEELRTPEGMRNAGNSATMHAFQNKATQIAAGILSASRARSSPRSASRPVAGPRPAVTLARRSRSTSCSSACSPAA